MAQNINKVENIVMFIGPGSVADTKKAQSRNHETGKGKTQTTAKYLGDIKEVTGKCAKLIDKKDCCFARGILYSCEFLDRQEDTLYCE